MVFTWSGVQELANHLRKRIKVSGIKAYVRHANSCGHKYVRVQCLTYEQPFDADQYREICQLAKNNGFTFVRGMEIDPNLFDSYGCKIHQIHFYHPEA